VVSQRRNASFSMARHRPRDFGNFFLDRDKEGTPFQSLPLGAACEKTQNHGPVL
jgi:hypothetical protein